MKNIKKWFLETALPWLKVSWGQIVNVIIVLFAYSKLDDLESPAGAVVGGWAFMLLAYVIFWKLFGVGKLFNKLRPDKH